MEPCNTEYHILVGNIGNDKVDRVALLCLGAILHVHNLAYDSSSVQLLAIDSGNR